MLFAAGNGTPFSVNLAVVFGASVPTNHCPVAKLKLPCDAVESTKINLVDGHASVTMMPLARFGPALLIVTVKLIGCPTGVGERPADWRTSWYYRYYHDPGDHNTARHYGVRTETHKLIYFDKKDQWECYDLVKDPEELKNIYGDPEAQPAVAALKTELTRLKKELGDNDRYADPKEWPKESSYVKPPPPRKP